MSSVQSFLKQVNPSMRCSYVASSELASLGARAFEFVPVSGNYVANYPPGAMVLASNSTNSALQNAIANAASVSGGAPNQSLFVLRDMGKTIFAPIASTEAVAQAGTALSAYGHFRQVQLLAPQAVSSNQVGGAGANVFGVFGGSPNYAPYLTFYLQNCVVGDFASPTAVPLLFNGEM